ncbi:hypothetical protein SODALDRAFT_332518 [Sodiomyces alkalinus F11]|uniref:Uncharacterized protein n=1 Tax=Sodiomyces alkalinus (strain CBS 110278 / VKM F-3762 / F11) TaxID=1314773 RepID=A0A3N2PX37_SODAK|nr:hypothetical protein SODALDRAFT_332518 [Sodiomyces alkalinus F11]ROT39090.1 hypothetical protein SODALDRAFT_332518 [Sodiomyces alkalinus F11]
MPISEELCLSHRLTCTKWLPILDIPVDHDDDDDDDDDEATAVLPVPGPKKSPSVHGEKMALQQRRPDSLTQSL